MRPHRLLVALLVPAAAWAIDSTSLGEPSLACTDFDAYVNGAWQRSTPIPPDRARIGSFETLRDDSRRVVERAIADAARAPEQLDTPGKRLATRFYMSGMDEAAIERRGLASLRPWLDAIDALEDRAQLPALIGRLARLGIAAPLRIVVRPDPTDTRRYLLMIDQGGLGLPDRDDYFRDDARTREVRTAYDGYRVRLATLAGEADGRRGAQASFDMQRTLAAASQTLLERRDPDALINLRTPDELSRLAPGFDWAAFFAALGVPPPRQVNVMSPGFAAAVAHAAQAAPLEQWRAYLRERLLDETAPLLPRAFVEARFDYRGRIVRGMLRRTERSQEVIDLITGPFGSEPLAEGFGQLYVARAFPPEAKAQALRMIEDIRAAMRGRIRQLDWMTAPTRQAALMKLDAMALKIGYPDRWKSYEGLALAEDDFAGNWLRAREWDFADRIGELPKPVDRTRWFTSPHLVNAFAGGLNEIVFPAAILQPPYFSARADPALNYGAIGMIIGHEITHHFDDRGRQFDAFGNRADWWTAADAAAYKARAERLAQQYSAYEPAPGERINGRQTLGENISDLGGIRIAFDGLQIALARTPVAPIDGFDQNQRFFLSHAVTWRANHRTAALIEQLRTGMHSPGRYRILGPLANFPAFGAAFGCAPDAPMLRAPAEQIVIW